jgi:hypothetical protein
MRVCWSTPHAIQGRHPVKQTTLLSLLLLTASSAGLAATVYDNFNIEQWNIVRAGTGPGIHEANQRLEISLAATSSAKSGAPDLFTAGYESNCQLQGNFDIQVDYSLLHFPPLNGVRVGLSFPDTDAFSVERTSFSLREYSGGEVYLVDAGHGFTAIPTTDKKGKLRAVREDGVISGYYFNATLKTWQLIGSASVISDPLRFRIALWSHNYAFDDKAVKVAFDNLIVNSGTLVGSLCPFAAGQISDIRIQ